MKNCLIFIGMLITFFIYADLPSTMTLDDFYQIYKKNYFFCRSNFDYDSRFELYLLEKSNATRFTENYTIAFYDRDGKNYHKIREYDLIESEPLMSINTLISLNFDNLPFPFRFSAGENIIEKDVDNDGIKELLLFHYNGFGADYITQVLKPTETKLIDMGKIYGLRTYVYDEDNSLIFIGRTITDTAILSTTDKTYYEYSIVDTKYRNIGLLTGTNEISVIRNQLEESFRLSRSIINFSDCLLFQFVHSKDITESVEWFDENKQYIILLEDELKYVNDIERKYIVPIREINDGINNPTTWYIYRDRIISRNELIEFSKTELRLLRNYIFSIHGYTFESNDLITYFSRYNCYNPTNSFSKDDLNDVEKYNINLILEYEQTIGS